MAARHFVTNFLPSLPNYALPHVSAQGYWRNDRQSSIGRKWLKYQAEKVYGLDMGDFRFCEHPEGR